MDFSITPSARVFKNYQTQERYGELNKKISVKVVQGQVDRVSISGKAYEAFEKGPEPQFMDAAPAPAEPVKEAPVEKADDGFQAFDFSSPEFSAG